MVSDYLRISLNRVDCRCWLFSGYGYLTQMLMKLTNGKLVMVLEGGFELEALCDCTETCIRTLRGENNFSKLSDQALTSTPNDNAVRIIRKVIAVQGMLQRLFQFSCILDTEASSALEKVHIFKICFPLT